MNPANPSPATISVQLCTVLPRCLLARAPLLASDPASCWRLFNGFHEGLPGLVVDWFEGHVLAAWHPGKHDQSLSTNELGQLVDLLTKNLPPLHSIWFKPRARKTDAQPQMQNLFGEGLPGQITEDGISYALNLGLNQDHSFYPDTRNLRAWFKANSAGRKVLNLFAYTGSLGVAALAGGASEAWQTDLNPRFLAIAERSAALNQFNGEQKPIAGDFYRVAADLKARGELFDTVILDAPFFSRTRAGKVDLNQGFINLVNKARPLVAHNGQLVVVNNALYLSGAALMAEYEKICDGRYLTLNSLVPVPQDCTGFPETIVGQPPVDPAPFNHPTKIAIFDVLRKDGRPAK